MSSFWHIINNLKNHSTQAVIELVTMCSRGLCSTAVPQPLLFHPYRKNARTLFPVLVRAQHSDKQSVVDLLKDLAIRTNRFVDLPQ